jgi:uncharacterized protein (DUF736 family)
VLWLRVAREGVGRPASASLVRHQGRGGREPDKPKGKFMQIIGSFKTTEDGGYAGSISTLVLSTKVTLVPNEKRSEKAPDFRILTGNRKEIGAAWKNAPEGKAPYISLTYDDPSFPAPISAKLVEEDSGELTLLWNRRKD